MGRASDIRIVDPVLTTLVRGYSNAQFVATVLFPIVTVQKEAGKIPTFGKEAFKIFNTERAMRANSNKLPVEARSSTDYALTEHDASYPVDYREVEEDIFDTRQYGSYRAQEAIMLRHEKICGDLAVAAGSYPAGNKVTLAGNDQWTDTANSDPIGVVEDAKEAVRKKVVKRPNTMIISAQSFKSLKNHPQLTERIKYSQLGVVTVDLLKVLFDIPNIVIGDAVYATDAGVITDIWGDSVVIAYIPEQQSNVSRSIYEPSFAYTLRKSGMPEVDTYFEEGGKIEQLRATDNFTAKIVGSDAGYLISDTNG